MRDKVDEAHQRATDAREAARATKDAVATIADDT